MVKTTTTTDGFAPFPRDASTALRGVKTVVTPTPIG
jgi:hypothetical protein